MGYIIPGGHFRRFGDTLINHDTQSNIIPSTKPIVINSIGDTQRRIARARSVTAATDISRTAPTFNDPRYTFTTLSIPTDLRTLNGLYRFFDDTDPVVGNSLRLHSEFPLSRVSLKDVGDLVISNHYHDMWNRIQMEKLLFDIALEFWRIGNVFAYGAWNTDDLMWEQFVILNPDYVTVEGTYLNQKPFIKLQPDEHLKRVVTTGQPKFLYDQLPKEIIKYIRMGQEIPLSPNNVFHIAHNKAPYETLGRSIIKRILKSLIYEDRMSMANFAIATRQTIPITVVKLGDPASVEEDHFVNFKENNELKLMTFKDMWEKYSGPITEHGENKQTKYVGTYNLFTLSQNSDGSQTWNKIEHILRHPTPDKVVEIQTPYGTTRSTEGHGYMWINPKTLKYEHVTPLQLQNRDNPTIVTMDKFDYSIKADKVFGLNLTSSLAYLLGLWTADGSFVGWKNKSGKHVSDKTIKISNSDEGIGINLVSVYFATKYVSTNDVTYLLSHEVAKELVTYYEMPRENSLRKEGIEKVSQEILFNSDDKVVGAFFAGVFDGDGWVSLNNESSKDIRIGISCGSSKEYHHWLSLALLAKGIFSKVQFRSGAWEIVTSGITNVVKFIKLVSPYLHHTKKKKILSEYKKIDEISKRDKIYTYDLDDVHKKSLFETTCNRFKGGDHPYTISCKRSRINRNLISNFGVDCKAKKVCNNLCGVIVSKINYKEKSSEYVYDLMLENEPHCYLVGGDGWLNTGNSGWVPGDDEIEEFRELMSAREVDPNFSLIYHWGIDIQFYGAGGKIWNLTNEFNRIMKWKLLGLGISENILTGGGSYASAYAQLEVLRQRYLHFQTMLQNFVYSGIFEPVASSCGFYKTSSVVSGPHYQGKRFGSSKDELTKVSEELSKHGKNFINDENQEYIKKLLQKQAAEKAKVEYVYPKLDWDLLSLSNDVQYKSFLMNFDRLFPGQRKISDQTFYAAARLDPEAEKTKIDREFKQGLEDKFNKAKILKEYKQKFIDAGLPIPIDIEPKPVGPGAPGSPGPGGSIVPAGGVPQLGGTGGGNLPGAPAMVPNAPVGKGQFEGGAPKLPRTPEASRLKSQQMHEHLTEAAIEIDRENQEEVSRLRKFNKEAGINVDQIDAEVKINVESEKKENSPES